MGLGESGLGQIPDRVPDSEHAELELGQYGESGVGVWAQVKVGCGVWASDDRVGPLTIGPDWGWTGAGLGETMPGPGGWASENWIRPLTIRPGQDQEILGRFGGRFRQLVC